METDLEIRDLLRSVRTIAVLGMKGGDADDAFRVPRYMQQQGYRIVPVNPKLDAVLGERAYACLAEVDQPVDLVTLFRAPHHVPAHAEEVLAMARRPRAVWMQLGVAHPEAAARLRGCGVEVVEDRCLMVEHGRLLGKA
jgi:predicted CoA-binding protein